MCSISAPNSPEASEYLKVFTFICGRQWGLGLKLCSILPVCALGVLPAGPTRDKSQHQLQQRQHPPHHSCPGEPYRHRTHAPQQA